MRAIDPIALARAFTTSAPFALPETPELCDRLQESVRAAAEAWPDLHADPIAFASWVAKRVREDDPMQIQWSDLWLAHCCATGQDAAIAAFERTFGNEIRSVVSDATPSVRNEFEQLLRDKLFAAGSESKIEEYSGRGTLRSWLRITARRTYLNFIRGVRRRREVADDRLMERASEHDLELEYLKEHYRVAFREAFSTAMTQLGTRERNLLRQHLVHRLSIDEIGELYEVHRATAARWLARAREGVLDGTRSHLAHALRVDATEFNSIMRLIASRLDVTVSRHLK